MDDAIRIVPAGDAALMVFFGEEIDPLINQKVHRLAGLLAQHPIAGSGEPVPAYASLTVHYDPAQVDFAQISRWVSDNLAVLETITPLHPRLVEIPTVYGGEFGPDLEFVAAYHHRTRDEVIQLHSEAVYMVYMMGFTPGFPYLGGLPAELATPRLENPRTLVRAGSVGIAGNQTGVYPIDSPGGWRLIGYSPVQFFNYHNEPPALLQPGDRVRFIPISPQELADA